MREKAKTHLQTAKRITDGAANEQRGLTAAEQKDYDGLIEKADSLLATVKRHDSIRDRLDEIDNTPLRNPGEGVGTNRGGLEYGGMTYLPRNMNPGEVRAYKPNESISEAPYFGPGLGTMVRAIHTGKVREMEEFRALGEGSTPGSYLVPTPLSTHLIDLVRNRTQVVNAGGSTFMMPAQTLKVARQTGDVSAGWKAESAAITFSDANFDAVTFTAQTLVAGSKLSVEVVEDAINIDQIVMNSIVQALALEVDRVCLYGTGTAPQPKGVKNQTGVTITPLATNGKSLTDFSDFSAGIATLMGNNFTGPFGAIYSARTAGRLDALKDTLGQPMRQPDNVAAMRKFVSNQVGNAFTVGTGTTCSDAFLAQWDQLMIGMRTNLTLEISRVAADSTGSAFSNLQVWIRAYLRCDCQLAHPLAFNVLTGIL
jgi:HK97 family phage major capsid protein